MNLIVHKKRQKWESVFWKLLACLFFAAINGVVRYLTGGSGQGTAHLSSPVITFWQNVFGTLFMLPLMLHEGFGSLKTKYPGRQLIRIFGAVFGVVLWYMALAHMTIAEAVALGFTGPIFSVIAARLYLKEKLYFFRVTGIILGFVGAFIIMRPDRALFGEQVRYGWFVALPLLSGIAIAISKLMSRELGAMGESPRAMTLTLLLFMTPCALVPALFQWQLPTLTEFAWLALMGAFATGAHFSTAKAYQLGEITFLTPFGFAKLIFSAVVGFVAFAEIPASQALWIGAAVIGISSVLLAWEDLSLASILKKWRA